MSAPTITPHAMRELTRPLGLLANAPDLDDTLLASLGMMLASENVTAAELGHAVVRVCKTSEFWPGPKALLDAVSWYRQQVFAQSQERAKAEATREREASMARLSASHADQPEIEWAPMDGLPVPPPREPLTRRQMEARNMFGPVLLPDGRRDPRWPEIDGRGEAWKRRMLYDHGIASYAQATAPSIQAAMKAKGPDNFRAFPEDAHQYPSHATRSTA